MNDSQGINLNIGFWEKAYPAYLAEQLSATVIDCSSLKFNKTSHIDMLLDNNVSLEEMKKLNNAGAEASFEKLAEDIHFPILKPFSRFASKSIFSQNILECDNQMYISDLLQSSTCPIVIYSSGANDLMFKANANPASLQKYDTDGNITSKYLYAEKILCSTDGIDSVLSGIEQNFCKILSINPEAKIFVLSIYIPVSINSEDYEPFIDAITLYNLKLSQLCEKYHLSFIDEADLGEIYNHGRYNFHISEVGHKELASLLTKEIGNHIYHNAKEVHYSYSYQDKGFNGYYEDLVEMADNVPFVNIDDSFIHTSLNVYLLQKEEKMEDARICKKFTKKRK